MWFCVTILNIVSLPINLLKLDNLTNAVTYAVYKKLRNVYLLLKVGAKIKPEKMQII